MSTVKCGITRLNTEELEYIWTIEEFPFVRRLASNKILPNYDRIISPKFGDLYNGEWYLTLFPAGVDCDGKMISIYLFTASDKIKVAIFDISILDENMDKVPGSEVMLSYPRIFTEADPSWGWEDYILVKEMEDESIKDDTSSVNEYRILETSNEVDAIPSPFDVNVNIIRSSQELALLTEEDGVYKSSHIGSHNTQNIRQSNIDIINNWDKTNLIRCVFNDKLCLKIVIKVQHGLLNKSSNIYIPSKYSDSFSKLRNKTDDHIKLVNDILSFSYSQSRILNEIIILRHISVYYSIPKYILAARSKYFEMLLTKDYRESDYKCYIIPDTDATKETFVNIVSYINTGDCAIFNSDPLDVTNHIIEMFVFSDKYGIISLFDTCIEYLTASITSESIWNIMYVANQCNCKVLLDNIHDYIKNTQDFTSLGLSLVKFKSNSTKLNKSESSFHSYNDDNSYIKTSNFDVVVNETKQLDDEKKEQSYRKINQNSSFNTYETIIQSEPKRQTYPHDKLRSHINNFCHNRNHSNSRSHINHQGSSFGSSSELNLECNTYRSLSKTHSFYY